jgi:hypothetical protein
VHLNTTLHLELSYKFNFILLFYRFTRMLYFISAYFCTLKIKGFIHLFCKWVTCYKNKARLFAFIETDCFTAFYKLFIISIASSNISSEPRDWKRSVNKNKSLNKVTECYQWTSILKFYFMNMLIIFTLSSRDWLVCRQKYRKINNSK